MSLEEVVTKGDKVESLKALRDYIARTLDGGYCGECDRSGPAGTEVAALSLRLTKIIEELDQVKPDSGVSKVDELANRRSSRISGTGT